MENGGFNIFFKSRSLPMIAILEAYPEIEFENIRQALNYKAYAV